MTVLAHKLTAESLINNAGKYTHFHDMQMKDSSFFLSVIDCRLQVAKWLIPSKDQ